MITMKLLQLLMTVLWELAIHGEFQLLQDGVLSRAFRGELPPPPLKFAVI